MGCIVTALAQPTAVEAIILLAPPTSVGERTRQHFTTKKGAEKQDDLWLVPRSDGTVSIIPESLFDQYEQVNALEVLQQLATQHPYYVIVAGADEVLTDADYTSLAQSDNVQLKIISGASHDFKGETRHQLLEATTSVLSA
jgi:dienelactone hydrolase